MRETKTPKSERTRDAIESAARRLFELNGFERTTVREIAAAASIDPALVIRYFGSKDELFGQVARPDLKLPDMTGVDPHKVGERLVRHFLDLWEGDEGGGGLPVLLRSAASNEAAATRLREVFAQQVLPVVQAIGTKENARERAGLISAQLLGLAMTRYILKLPPVVALEHEFIVREVGATIQRYAALK